MSGRTPEVSRADLRRLIVNMRFASAARDLTHHHVAVAVLMNRDAPAVARGSVGARRGDRIAVAERPLRVGGGDAGDQDSSGRSGRKHELLHLRVSIWRSAYPDNAEVCFEVPSLG